jgi:hypothetical protein
MEQQLKLEEGGRDAARAVAANEDDRARAEARRDHRDGDRRVRLDGSNGLVLAALLVVVVGVLLALYVVAGDQESREVVSNADEVVALRDEKSALVAGSRSGVQARQDEGGGHDGAAAAKAANAVAQSAVQDAEEAREQEALDQLVARGLVPDGSSDREDEVLDDLVARGLVPDGDRGDE